MAISHVTIKVSVIGRRKMTTMLTSMMNNK